MKKIFQILVAVMAVVILTNCGSKQGPETVAENFLKHLNQKEYAEAKKLGTEATQQMITFLESFPAEDVAVEELTIENMKCTEEGDNATCTYTENGQEANVNLTKVDGKWLVDMPKEMPEEDMAIEEEANDSTIVEEATEVTEETEEVIAE